MAIIYVDGKRLRRAIGAGANWLSTNREHVNAINVFPVPDGDTGTNMVLTLRAAIEQAEQAGKHLPEVARTLADGALLGARGNSGVILSQIFQGFARSIGEEGRIGALGLARGIEMGAELAYRAVAEPVEGTILTVASQGAQAATWAAENGGDVITVLEATLSRAEESLANTPRLLVDLRDAGVVDAGGQGYVYLLEGIVRLLQGEEVGKVAWEDAEEVGLVRDGWDKELGHRYCTEFVVQGIGLPIGEVKERLFRWGDSLFVVGSDRLIRVHLHTDYPQQVLDYTGGLGTLSRIKVDDMEQQHRDFLYPGRGMASSVVSKMGMVAVGCGEGMAKIFKSLGVDEVVKGGATINPSVAQILEAVERVPSSRVIFLPNDPNVIPSAQQVQGLSSKEVSIIPSRSIPQGIAALVAFNPEEGWAENVENMVQATGRVSSGEVVRAIGDRDYREFLIRKGDVLGFFEGELKVVGEDVRRVIFSLLEKVIGPQHELLTLYYGEGVAEGEARDTVQTLREAFPGLEVEAYYGGQPYHHYLISLE